MQKSLKNVIFNGIAQSVLKTCHWDPLKAFALKHFTKSPMNSFFRKEHPVQKKKTIMETYFLRTFPKVLLKFIDCRKVP